MARQVAWRPSTTAQQTRPRPIDSAIAVDGQGLVPPPAWPECGGPAGATTIHVQVVRGHQYKLSHKYTINEWSVSGALSSTYSLIDTLIEIKYEINEPRNNRGHRRRAAAPRGGAPPDWPVQGNDVRPGHASAAAVCGGAGGRRRARRSAAAPAPPGAPSTRARAVTATALTGVVVVAAPAKRPARMGRRRGAPPAGGAIHPSGRVDATATAARAGPLRPCRAWRWGSPSRRDP